MKKLFFLITFALSMTLNAQENINVSTKDSFDKLWITQQRYANDDLPKSVDKVADVIMEKAMKENDFQNLAKALLTKANARMQISTDSILVDIQQIELLLDKPVVKNGTDAPAKIAVTHALIASVYRAIYQSSLTRANAELRQECLSKQKIHISDALNNKSHLANIDALKYKNLLKVGKDSKLFNNDVLSLILLYVDENGFYNVFDEPKEEKIDHLTQTKDIYDNLGMRDAALLTQLQILDVKYSLNSRSQRLRRDDYLANIKKLYEENTDIETGADAFLKYYRTAYFDSKKERDELLAWAEPKFKNTKHGQYISQLKKALFDKDVNVSVDGNIVAHQNFVIRVSHVNVNQVTVTIRDSKNQLVFKQTINDNSEKPQETKYDTLSTSLPPQNYFVTIEAEGLKQSREFKVTSLKLVSFNLPDKGTGVTVLDAITGLPKDNCKTVFLNHDWKDGKYVTVDSIMTTTDKYGQVFVERERFDEAYAFVDENDVSNVCNLSGRQNYDENDDEEEVEYKIFTDRAIYKPGQTVYMTGYVYLHNGDDYRVMPNKSVIIQASDPNWQNFYSKKLVSDQFGMVTDSITIPKDRVNGRYCIEFGNVSEYISVEEYKRPTFNIEFEDLEGTMAFGDTVTVVGKATTYSGVPVQGANVQIVVNSKNGDFWTPWRYGGAWKQIETSETKTDDEGKFSVKVFLNGDQASDESFVEWRRYFSGIMLYKVSAKVTDMAGESHENETVLRVSDREFSLRISMDDVINIDDSASFVVDALNIDGKKVNAQGKWKLLKYVKNVDNPDEGKFQETGINGEFEANKPVRLQELAHLPLGTYIIEIEAFDGKNNEYSSSHKFVTFSKDEKPICLMEDWIYAPTSIIREGEGVDIYFALNAQNPYLYAYLISSEKVEWQRIDACNNNLKHLHFDYKPEYKNGLAVYLMYVKNDQLHQLNQSFKYEKPDKQLKLSWTTFRDKLRPGQQETWTLNIKDKDGKPIKAQMLATMYDASLDALQPNNWSFFLSFYRNCPYIYSNHSSSGSNSLYFNLPFESTKIVSYAREYNHLLPFEYGIYYSRGPRMAKVLSRNMVMADIDGAVAEASMDMAEPMAMMADEDAYSSKQTANETQLTETPSQEVTVDIRSDFRETAFYYPALTTNENGDVTIAFTLPESLTEWNFMGFAHTKELDYGLITAKTVARKEFMVQPNMPRFIRSGDEATITTKIINQEEKNIRGKARIRLINPDNDEVILEQVKEFNVEASKTTAVTFEFKPDDKYDMLICEIAGFSDETSDGERNWLPILPDKKLITETVPFYIQGQGTKDIDISSLFNYNSPTATNRKVVFEYTDNPTWNVILAMHAVMNPKDDDAISWSAALYANSALMHLAKRVPHLSEYIEQWKNETGDETTLQSELEKNQQLKDILIKEAPWMLEAKEETISKQKMVELFDQQMLNSRISQAKEKLADLQLSNGAWTWFKGMQPSYYTTFAVCDNLAKLYEYMKHSGDIIDQNVNKMLNNGLKYLDNEELEDYKKYAKKNKKEIPGNTTLHYMYMVASTDHPMDSNTKSMINNYLKRLKGKVKQMTTYGKANIAVTLMAFGKNKDALPYIKSLREYTVTKPGMGRFFDGESTYYSWCDYRIPSHVATMKAFLASQQYFSDAQDYLNDMQIWLLRQKQTQQWNSVVNTINAVDLLLTISPDSTFYQEQLPSVKFGNTEISIDNQTAAVGFVKTDVDDYIVQTTMNSGKPTVTVEKHSPGISWGAVFGQSLEKLDNMKQNGNELTVERKYYVENNGQWIPVDEEYVYKVGDKIRIRHIITADRDMDFVQVRAQHAACLEPVKTLSGYQMLGGRGGYLSLHDASADFFFDKFYKGTATIDLDMYVTSTGNYSDGIVTVQCAYAPDFAGHSKGYRVIVE